jgi:hypothetical protein
MAFLRFATAGRHPESGVADGVFRQAYRFRESTLVSQADRDRLSDLLGWFEAHLITPKRFNASKSKGYYRRRTKGISWLRDGAQEHVAKMYELKVLLESNGCPVTVIREDRIGYVVYEDEFQAVAEPFADTKT